MSFSGQKISSEIIRSLFLLLRKKFIRNFFNQIHNSTKNLEINFNPTTQIPFQTSSKSPSMPPKKKDSKKSLKPAPSEDPSQSIETTTFPIEKHSIPKKPIYKAIRCTTETRARLIQVKLWKAHYLYLADPLHGKPASDPSDPDIKNNLYNLMSSKTSRKALKTVRKLSLDKHIKFIALKRFLTQKFKLERLRIGFPVGPPILNMLKNSIYPDIKDLVLNESCFNRYYQKGTWESLLDFLSCFKFVRALSLNPFLQNSIPQSTTFSIPKLRKLKRLEWQQYFELFLFEPKFSRHLSALQDLTFNSHNLLADHALYSSLIPLSNIRNLTLLINSPYQDQPSDRIDFASLSKLVNLESFSLSYSSTYNLVIDDFSFLYNLKKLSLHKSTMTSILFTPPLDSLGNLPKLESLELSSFKDGVLDRTFFKNLLSKTPNLKALSISLSAHSLNQVLEEGLFDFSLEKLSLRTHKITIPFIAFSKSLSSFIKQNSNLKGLGLYFSESYHDFLEPIMKCVKSLNGLEDFKLALGKPIELQDRKIPLLKDVISKLESLRSIHLELPEHSFDSREVSGFTTAFMKHERLEKLVLHVGFTKVSDESYKKFVELIRDAKKIKSLKLCIKGCPEEKEKKLEKALGYDISYWEYSGMKISSPESFFSFY